MTNTPPPAESAVPNTPAADDVPFLSLASLRVAHRELLQLRRGSPADAELTAAVTTFLQRGRLAGQYLDADEDRWEAQNLLDYWENELFHAGHEVADALLLPFDPALQPTIPDHLCPYVGLDAFQPQQRELFFGRSQLIAELVAQVNGSRLVGVLGPSGSGKSSAVLAGLLPQLQAGHALPGSDQWHYLPPIVPGSAPLTTLARLLAPPDAAPHDRPDAVDAFRQNATHLADQVAARFDTPVVLTIDQFEEVFTLCLDESERHAFVDNLLHLVQTSTHRHTIILTMRSDYESYLATMPLLQALFEQNAVRVDAMTAGELREAVEKPAEMVGLKFQEGLVDELLREIVGEPAALPLLQFALLRLWEMRERNRVTWDAYRRLGSVSQALATTADALYAALIPEEQVTARRILLRLVRPSEGLEVTRNRIPRRLLYQASEAPDRVDRVLDKLIQARLVHLTQGDTAADDQLEVAHEALVRNWPMLVSWLDEERILLRQRLRLTSLAQNWEARGRDPDALLRGALLKEAQAYEDLNSLEQEFLQASQAAQAREEAQKEAARQRELQTARQLAEEQQQRAEAERQRAEAQAVAAQRLRWISIALLVGLLVAVGSAVLWINNLNLQNTAARADATAAAIAAQSTTEALRASLANATIQAEQTQTANQVATSQAQTAGRATAVAAADATVRAATATAQYDAALATQAAIAAAQVTPTPIPRTPQGSAPTDTPEPTATPDPAVVAAQLAVDAQLQARVRERDQMPMLYVSGRPFLMGSPADSPEAAADELPAHAVTLDDYFIDQYEVTVQQYAAFLNDIGGYRGLCGGFDCIETGAETQYTYLLNNLGVYEPKAGYESFPANWVTWHGAQAYCSWAGARLPTEAEWEYAARGIDGRIYPWGSDLPAPSRAVSGWPNTDRGFLDALQPVSALPDGTGAFGAYGMAGGVAEWVQDWYDPTYYAANPGGAPNTAADSGQRVLRGGAWYSPAADVRATARDAALPTIDRSSITQQLRYRGVGFRCAADAGP